MNKKILSAGIFAGLFVTTFITETRAQSMIQNWLAQTNNDAISNSDDVPRQTLIDNSGHVAIIGESNGKIVVAAYDQYGNNLWTNKYNSLYNETVAGFEEDLAGNYYAGYYWGGTVRKINPAGNTVWTTGTSAYHGYSISTDKYTGNTYAFGTDYPTSTIYCTKINNSGSAVNTQTYLGHYGLGGVPVKSVVDGSGKIIVLLNMNDSAGKTKPGLAKFDANGNFVWEYTFTGKTGQVADLCVDTISNAIYVTGYVDNTSNKDLLVMKIGAAGSLTWMNIYNEPVLNGDDYGNSIVRDATGNIYAAALTPGGNPNMEYIIRKYSSTGTVLATKTLLNYYYNAFVPGPRLAYNPSNHKLYMSGTINVSGYDNKMQMYSCDLALSSINTIYSFDGINGGNDYGADMDIDRSGHPVLTGNTYATLTGNSYYYVNTDTLGNFNYSNLYNGIINGVDEASDVIADNNNLPVVAASTKSVFTDFDGMLIKYDALGNVVFQSIFDGGDSLADKFLKVDTTTAGQYYACGYTGRPNQFSWLAPQNNMWAVKTDANGALLWQYTFNGSQPFGDDQFSDMTTDASNNLYLSGWVTNAGTGLDASIIKLNSSGVVLWNKKFTGAGNNSDAFNCLVKSGIGNYYAAGYLTNSNGNKDVLLCKYDASGNLAWSANYNSAQNGNDQAIGITNDASNNVYMACISDSAKVITVKYNANGTLAWARPEPTMVTTAPSIVTTPGGKTVILCEKDSGFYNFQTIICYDNSGNQLWSRRYNYSCCEAPMKLRRTSRGTILVAIDYYQYIGAIELDTLGNERNNTIALINPVNNNGGTRAMSIDKNGDVYVAGYFPVESGSDVYTMKLCYTPAPVTLLGSHNVCAQSQGNIYSVASNTAITGYNWSTAGGLSVSGSSSNNTTISAGASSGYVILQQSNYCGTSQPDSLFVNVNALPLVNAGADQTICPNGSVTLNGSGALNYVWSGGVANGVPFTPTTSQSYQLTGTDANGCSNEDTVTVLLKSPAAISLCMVTVDSLSTHNILTWEKTGLSNDVDYFNIYREDITNNYTLIAAVDYDSLSQYHDYDMTYANPNVTTKRYKISAVDTCGNEGVKSPFHNTIFITDNNGSFTWNTYVIQGAGNPVNSYALMRDDLSNGNWNQIGTTAGTQNLLSDPNYTTYQATGSWRVETIWNISCTPTFRQSNGNLATVVKSKSNISNNRTMGIKSSTEGVVTFYPNPTSSDLTISLNGSLPGVTSIKMISLLGKEMYSATISEENKHVIDMSVYPTGTYLIQVTNNTTSIIQRVIKN